MQQDDLRTLLTAFAAERLALLQRHEAAARLVSHYDFNNTYQYVISREETHVSWLENALGESGTPMPQAAASPAVPTAPKKNLLGNDERELRAFVERWRDRIETMTHARHRLMLKVVLGESLEHARLFEQAAAGFEDVLGRRTGGVPRVGEVLPTRWLE